MSASEYLDKAREIIRQIKEARFAAYASDDTSAAHEHADQAELHVIAKALNQEHIKAVNDLIAKIDSIFSMKGRL